MFFRKGCWSLSSKEVAPHCQHSTQPSDHEKSENFRCFVLWPWMQPGIRVGLQQDDPWRILQSNMCLGFLITIILGSGLSQAKGWDMFPPFCLRKARTPNYGDKEAKTHVDKATPSSHCSTPNVKEACSGMLQHNLPETEGAVAGRPSGSIQS